MKKLLMLLTAICSFTAQAAIHIFIDAHKLGHDIIVDAVFNKGYYVEHLSPTAELEIEVIDDETFSVRIINLSNSRPSALGFFKRLTLQEGEFRSSINGDHVYINAHSVE